MMAAPAPKPSFARSVLVGLIVLAVAAIIIAWMDQAGVGQTIVRVLDSAWR